MRWNIELDSELPYLELLIIIAGSVCLQRLVGVELVLFSFTCCRRGYESSGLGLGLCPTSQKLITLSKGKQHTAGHQLYASDLLT